MAESTPADFDGILEPQPGWRDVPCLSEECIAYGDANGSMNAQATALTARLEHLRIALALGVLPFAERQGGRDLGPISES